MMSCQKTGVSILTIYTSYDENLHEKVLFGDRDVTAPHLGGKIPQKLHLGRE